MWLTPCKNQSKQDIIIPLGIDETAKWCTSFILLPKPNGNVRLCLDPVRLQQTPIRSVSRSPTLNDIFPKPNNAKYLSLADAGS